MREPILALAAAPCPDEDVRRPVSRLANQVKNELRQVAVLADDLIWASRLTAAVEHSGGRPLRMASLGQLNELLAADSGVAGVLIDLNGRDYDGVEAVHMAAQAGQTVLAVGQHEDVDLRRRALAAGARRVYPYNKLFREGAKVVGDLLAGRL